MRTTRFLLTVLILLASAPALASDGAALYGSKCASCHGADGKAETPAAKAMKVPPVAGSTLTADEIVAKLKASDRHKAIVGKLTDAELIAIANALPGR